MATPAHPAPPEEWHPFYEHHRRSLDWWLNNRRDWQDRLVPIVPRLQFWEEGPTTATDVNLRRLTKHKAFGPAPYVGCPFGYLWPVAVDDLGRQIAGRSSIVYTDELCRLWRRGGGDCPTHGSR